MWSSWAIWDASGLSHGISICCSGRALVNYGICAMFDGSMRPLYTSGCNSNVTICPCWWTWSQCNIDTVDFYIWTSPPMSVSSAPVLLAGSICFIMRWTVLCKTSFTASGLHRWWASMEISVAFSGNKPASGGCVEKSVEDDAGCSPGVILRRLSSHTPCSHHCSCYVTAPCLLVRSFGDFVIWPWLILLPSLPRIWHRHDPRTPALI